MTATSDEDDDTHFCLKCHATITGLDNYVAHRKSKCGRLDPQNEQPATEATPKLKADDFFFSLHLKSSAKNVADQTSLVKPITKTAGIITRSKIKRPEICQRVEEDSDADESEEDTAPAQTGGKWKPGQNPGSSRYSSVAWPPPGHTGGKWKPQAVSPLFPGSPPPPTEKVITNYSEISEEVMEEHTSQQNQSQNSAPPPEHTRGKWGPTERPWGQLRKSSLYWCGPCNRRLSSKVVYDRHLRSELHFKRTNTLSNYNQQPPSASNRRSRAAGIKALRTISYRFREPKEISGSGNQLVRRRQGPRICEVCGCHVWPQRMGKHLISHYHVSRLQRTGQNDFSRDQILANISAIVKLSPFQCALCKFYCNTQQSFVNHWTSELHRENDAKKDGCYWCIPCKYWSVSTVEMGWHLVDNGHCELISLINHSVPIVIHKRIALHCDVCRVVFRYNVQIRAHSRIWGHRQAEGTASDTYQELVQCNQCRYTAHSLLSYQRHVRKKHGNDSNNDQDAKRHYFCRSCSLMFSNATEAKQHRQSQQHRDSICGKRRRCIHCGETTTTLAQLKSHLSSAHPDNKHRCIKCGAEFLLRQELSRHVRCGECNISASTSQPTLDTAKTEEIQDIQIDNTRLSCNSCNYIGSTEVDLVLHKTVLHQEPTNDGTYQCVFCGQYFKLPSFKKHIATHSNERPHTCSICHFSFRRRDILRRHIKRIHENPIARNYLTRPESDALLECSFCQRSFLSRPALDRHMTSHQTQTQYTFETRTADTEEPTPKRYVCQEADCIYRARSEAELKIHMKTHSDLREYHCQQCPYSSKTKGQLAKHVKGVHGECRLLCCQHCDFTTKYSSHLKRHMRLHSGAKPYTCPHCSFTCNLLENLRKHVLQSKTHRDKSLYECKTEGCTYRTNFAKEFKSHLVQQHGSLPNIATAYVTGLYRPADDPVTVHNPRPVTTRKRKRSASIREDGVAPLPTLASVALTPQQTNKPSENDDVIFIQVQEEYDMAAPLYASETPLFADQQAPRPPSFIIHDETFAQTVVSYGQVVADQTHDDNN